MASDPLKMFKITDFTDFGFDGIGKFPINLKPQMLINLVGQQGMVDLSTPVERSDTSFYNRVFS